MKRYSTFALLLAAALLAVLLVPGLTLAQAAPQEIQVTLSEFSITPGSFTVTQGQPIHFVVTNTGKFPHSISFVKDGKFLTVFAQPIAGGKSGSADFTFEEAGTWQMYCPVSTHAERGMVGQVTVMAAGAPGMPRTGEPTTTPLLVAGLVGLVLLTNGLLLRRRLLRRG